MDPIGAVVIGIATALSTPAALSFLGRSLGAASQQCEHEERARLWKLRAEHELHGPVD